MNQFLRYLTISLLFFLLAAPTQSIFAQTKRSNQELPIIATCYKKPPPKDNFEKQPTTYFETSEIEIVKTSNAKRKPTGLHHATLKSFLKKLTAKNAIIMDATSGDVLYAKSPDQPRQPASTIKVLTGLIALENLGNNEKVPVSRRASRMPRSKIYLDQRKTYCASDLIDAVLLASANDASVALAEKIAGSEKAFARLMTRKALKLGAKKTICKTASGLTRRGQCSTVRDLAIIFNKAMENPKFAERISQTKIETRDGKMLRNHNKALWKINGAEGGKTGYTWAAKQTYVGKFKRGQDTLVIALMGSKTMWKDIKNLVEYGFSKKQQLDLAYNKYPQRKLLLEQKASVTKKSQTPSAIPEIILSDNKKVTSM